MGAVIQLPQSPFWAKRDDGKPNWRSSVVSGHFELEIKGALPFHPLICRDFSSSPTPLVQLHIPEVLAADLRNSLQRVCVLVTPAIVQNLEYGPYAEPRAV
jgi:hypothetical protein